MNATVVVGALLVTALDALTKAWARHALASRDLHVWRGLWFRLQYNAGISFSFNRSGPLATTVLTALITAAVAVVGLRARHGLASVGFALLVGGGAGNVLDRMSASPARVTDFVALGSFPVFNLADVAISAGFLTLLVVVLRGERLLAR